MGWEVRLDGMEITQFTYFQEVGSIELDPITVELTYGLERIAMYIQGVDSIYDLMCGQKTFNTTSFTMTLRSSFPLITLRLLMLR